MIKVRNLNKYYNRKKSNEIHVIHNTSLELPDQGLVCILGESGSGKTTLMNTISGLDDFSDGVIEVDGVSIEKYGQKKQEQIRNSKFGYIFQNYYLLMERTVEYNIMLALSLYDLSEEEKKERMDYVLNAVDMYRYKKRLVGNLSGGQQQRIAIARALAKAPKVIFADEPTGNLDEANTMHIMGILKKLSKECLVIVVTHEKEIAEFFADRIIWICDGKIEKDETQEGKGYYQYIDDGNLYLKDFQKDTLQTKNIALDIYHHSEKKEMTIRLVYESGKLYLNAGDSKNIEFLTKQSEKKMIDSTRPVAEMKDVDEILFELSPVESKKKPKMKFGEILDVSKENIRALGKKQIFLTLVLMTISILLTISVWQILSTFVIDKQAVISSDTHNYRLSVKKNQAMMPEEEYRQYFGILTELLEEQGYELNLIPKVSLTYQYQGFSQLENYQFEMEGYNFVPVDKITEADLIYGKLPENDMEVVLDEWFVENFRKSSLELENMITEEKQVIGNTILTDSGVTLTICGISRTEQPDIYVRTGLMTALSRELYSFLTEDIVIEQFQDYEPQNLTITEDGKVQVLVKKETLSARYHQDMGNQYGELSEITSEIFRAERKLKDLKHIDAEEERIEQAEEKLLELEAQLQEAEERLGITVEEFSDMMNSPEKYLNYQYEDILTGNVMYQVVGYYEVDADVGFIAPKEATHYFEKALMDGDKRCYIYTSDENPQEEIKKIESCFTQELKEKLVITVKNESDDALNVYREENKAKFNGRILVVLALFVISVFILYFTMKSNVILRMTDIGVYRMLGISKFSILSMFACENFLITTYTSLVGVLLTVGGIKIISGIESLQMVDFYPWYAVLLTIVFFYCLNIIVGIMPVRKMLKLPPAQLAAKYDI